MGLYSDVPCPSGDGIPYKVEGEKDGVVVTFRCKHCGNDWTERKRDDGEPSHWVPKVTMTQEVVYDEYDRDANADNISLEDV